jgi:uncharacterized protein
MHPDQLIASPEYQRGAACYRKGEFFEAHEHWEDLWKTLEGEKRLLVQGLIQVAAAWVKRQRGEPVGMRRLLDSAIQKWRALPSPLWGVELAQLRKATLACLEAAGRWERGDEEEVALASLPQIP